MTPKQLDENLDEEMRTFSKEIMYLVESHDGNYLDGSDMEDIGRQVFYTLMEFKKHMVEYAKENEKAEIFVDKINF